METYEAEKARYGQFFDGTSGQGYSSRTNNSELRTTPLFTVEVRRAVDEDTGATDPVAMEIDPKDTLEAQTSQLDPSLGMFGLTNSNKNQHVVNGINGVNGVNGTAHRKVVLPQYALLGHHVGEHDNMSDQEPIFLNTRAPNSFFVCGSQGSGKSYTVATILENCLLPDPKLGSVANPIAGVAFHYDVDDTASLAELASLCSRGIKVRVLVSISNYLKLAPAYQKLDKAHGNLTVEPLLFQDTDLSIENLHKLMAFSGSENTVPLYMEKVNQILRDMAVTGAQFTLLAFETALQAQGFQPAQKAMLNMRLDVLKGFLAQGPYLQYRPTRDLLDLTPGELTVIDLSDTFIDAETVCALFDVCLGMIKKKKGDNAPLILALDEAHKYLKDSPSATKFTDRLLTTIREQRHNGTRVIIATQEPTIAERLLDLCSTSIIHRFTSPAWFSAIKEHIGGASSLIISPDQQKEMLDNIINLQAGDSFVFSPSSFLRLNENGPQKLGSGNMKMRTRVREGLDIGSSKMADGDN